MAKTIAQRSIELAEANAELLAKVGSLDGSVAQLTAQLAEMTAKSEAAVAQVSELSASLDAARAELVAVQDNAQTVAAERDALTAKVNELSATLALSPQVKQPAGQPPIASADAGDGQNAPQTWPQALAACGNDYVAARKAHPALFEHFVKTTKHTKGE